MVSPGTVLIIVLCALFTNNAMAISRSSGLDNHLLKENSASSDPIPQRALQHGNVYRVTRTSPGGPDPRHHHLRFHHV
ncbi:unnamed protein product [Sphenostylis stenocarpa]|uniref:Uncharacterized protein n=1 Tax=Sphenostylis stenocarpa TaxID=92480 RepID=A0AA86S8P7_9FABA|nr:unnamed protein product [Sphenostylis stenocarpa]